LFAGACWFSTWFDGEWIPGGEWIRQLESFIAVRSLHDRDGRPYTLEPDDAVHPRIFDGCLALQHESELDEELSRRCEVVNHDADVLNLWIVTCSRSVSLGAPTAATAGPSPAEATGDPEDARRARAFVFVFTHTWPVAVRQS
jgi:hypothetical protein